MRDRTGVRCASALVVCSPCLTVLRWLNLGSQARHKAPCDRVRMHRMKARSKAAAGGMDIDFGDAMYNDGIDIGDPDVPMMEGDPTEKVQGTLQAQGPEGKRRRAIEQQKRS